MLTIMGSQSPRGQGPPLACVIPVSPFLPNTIPTALGVVTGPTTQPYFPASLAARRVATTRQQDITPQSRGRSSEEAELTGPFCPSYFPRSPCLAVVIVAGVLEAILPALRGGPHPGKAE